MQSFVPQSDARVHCWPSLQALAHRPPQSTSVSAPFLTPSSHRKNRKLLPVVFPTYGSVLFLLSMMLTYVGTWCAKINKNLILNWIFTLCLEYLGSEVIACELYIYIYIMSRSQGSHWKCYKPGFCVQGFKCLRCPLNDTHLLKVTRKLYTFFFFCTELVTYLNSGVPSQVPGRYWESDYCRTGRRDREGVYRVTTGNSCRVSEVCNICRSRVKPLTWSWRQQRAILRKLS